MCVYGPRSDLPPKLPQSITIFSIYPRERLKLGGMRYRHNLKVAIIASYRNLPQSGASIIVSLNSRAAFTTRAGVAPIYRKYIEHCKKNADGRLVLFPRGNEPQ